VISILILTRNEEQDLPGCLEAVRWSDDVHVYDSMSTDRTVEIAEGAHATITRRPFDNWAAHQNWGLRNIRFKYPWVFYVDADERVTAELASNAAAAVARATTAVAYRVQRRDFLLDTWLRHVQASPYFIRLFRPEFVSYERLVNPVTHVQGAIGEVSGALNHFPFSKGLGHWLARHNSYSSFEAEQIVTDRKGGRALSVGRALWSRDFNERRYHQKELFYRLPARPLIKFVLLYLVKGGFLDGRAGLTYACLQSMYEYMIVLKTRELMAAARQ
jgi:glycosyltransferase involved in cell wall biosynthesis